MLQYISFLFVFYEVVCYRRSSHVGGLLSRGTNIIFVDCFIGRPLKYCPIDNNHNQAVCEVAYHCPGFMCRPGCLMLSHKNPRCIKSSKCHRGCNGDPNAIPQSCPSSCPPTCDEPNSHGRMCIAACDPSGCVCKPGYILTKKNGRCVKPSDCPKIGCNSDPNAIPHSCPSSCPPTCDEPNSRGNMCIAACDPSGCVCKPGYILTKKNGRCVKPKDCPAKPLQCGYNEVAVERRTICPPQNCEIAYTEYSCEQYKNIYEPGCDCLPNHLRNGSGICIPNDNCSYPTFPICGINEIARDCKRKCPPQTCETRFALFKCSSNIPCEPGCDCIPTYLRNSDGICVSAEKCDLPSTKCIRTCGSPNPPNCPYKPAETNIDGHNCMEGYILSEVGGKCIKIEDCPSNITCNGDPHARAKRCPLACPSTCESPNATPCKRMCDPIGCECEPGYIFSKIGGKCILPDDCPGGNPCPINSEFRQCKYNCPQDYCPEDDNSDRIVCDPAPICLSGCACKLNHRRLSYQNDTCIISSDCPPVNCTRPNEVWDPCPPGCFSGYCAEKEYQDVTCNSFVLNCQPKCVCKRDTFRNGSDICVPASECPPTCTVPNECLRTCALPNPPNCPYVPSLTNYDGCECMEGFILSEIGGRCIRIEDCPRTCNNDPNARARQCPLPCPSTCESPNARHCKKMCEPIGCECEPGYIFSKVGGKCIYPDDCPGGNPCPKNAEYRQCKYNCPEDYCPADENLDRIVCDPPRICLSGCTCKLNHRRLSYSDDTCVVASDCPPVNCTRPNEVWNGCPSGCFSGYCADKEYQDVTCNSGLLNCQPKCVCKKDTFRNDSDICVPASECPPTCTIPENCRPTCALPNPPNCPYLPSQTNKDGCECMEGYILSEIGGICIKIENCPSDVTCNGDPNARPKQCPAPCPSTCKSPEQIPCKVSCQPIGCECKPGYIRSNRSGRCILPEHCLGGNPCGPNANFVPCKYGCPTNYCPVNDNRGILICEPSPICLSGCACQLNHKWLSREDKTCIESSDCPPVNCTRPNEVWSSCPSACLAEDCRDVNHQPSTCNTLVHLCDPRCICKEGFFRNANDICVPACDC